MRIACDTKDTLPLSALTEFQGGLKKRTAEDTAKIEKSIRKYGFATPFFVWRHEGKNLVLDGHGRLQTLKSMAASGEEIPALPVVYIDCKDEVSAKSLLLRICSTYGEMTAESVADFIAGGGIDLNINEIALPCGKIDLSAIFDEDDTKGDDETPPVEIGEPSQSKAGEIYQLGDHRLICGDSTDTETLAQLMGGEKADLMLTDPPYNVDYTGKDGMKIDNDRMGDSEFQALLVSAFRAMFAVAKSGAAYYIFYAHTKGFVNALATLGIRPHQVLIWVKNTFTLSHVDYKWRHEPIMYGWKDGGAHKFYGALNESTVKDTRKDPEKMSKAELVAELKYMERAITQDIIYEKKPSRNAEHPTMKPIELLSTLIKNSTKADDVVLDPFGGSGSTLIAAAKTGRVARLCEVNPHYCDVIRKRWTKWAKDNGYAVGDGGLE